MPLVQKRPARTPPSTFLFLPIHLSNSPEPCGSVVINRPPAICRSRRSPHIRHGQEPAGCSFHRENSEGLRRRAIAPKRRRRAKKGYIVFAPGCCQPFGGRKKRCGSSTVRQILPARIRYFAGPGRRTAATFLRRSLHYLIGVSHQGVSGGISYAFSLGLLSFQPWSLKLSALATRSR